MIDEELVKQSLEAVPVPNRYAQREPTLDVNLGKEIGLIRSLDIRIAVINNGSLLRAHPMKEEATVELLNRFESVLKSSTKWSEITV
jgi:wyosine [tRNA(Phe)-imidazoG37] synthetase (radical SAM superfamily)